MPTRARRRRASARRANAERTRDYRVHRSTGRPGVEGTARRALARSRSLCCTGGVSHLPCPNVQRRDHAAATPPGTADIRVFAGTRDATRADDRAEPPGYTRRESTYHPHSRETARRTERCALTTRPSQRRCAHIGISAQRPQAGVWGRSRQQDLGSCSCGHGGASVTSMSSSRSPVEQFRSDGCPPRAGAVIDPAGRL